MLRTKKQIADGFLSIKNMRSIQLREHIAKKGAAVARILKQTHVDPPADTSIKRLREIALSLHNIG